MATNTQVGKYLYNNIDMPLYGKVLSFLNQRQAGASFVTIAGQPELTKMFNGDIVRTQTKVKTVLSNLRFRSVVNEVSVSHGYNIFKIANKDDALTLIAEAGKIVDKMTQRAADVVSSNDKAEIVTQTNKTKKVNTMATKTVSKKAPRLFINPETSKVEPFGAGRPSKLKLANECNAEGKFLDPNAALAFAQNGGKSEDKLTKAELLDLLRKVRAERDEALAAVETLKSVIAPTVEDSIDADADESDDLDLDAEEVDSDESDEVEATDAE
jgi:hypothetical protein